MLKMLKKFIAVATVVIMPAIYAQPVQAALWDFSYDFDGVQSIDGQLVGDLQLDLDTINVTDVFAIITTPGGPYSVDTTVDYFLGLNSQHDVGAIVSITGITMDFILHQNLPHGSSCFESTAMCLIADTGQAIIGGVDLRNYDPRRWEISRVPEPSIIALFGLGLLGLGFARRRKVQS